MPNSFRHIGSFAKKMPPKDFREGCLNIRQDGVQDMKDEVSTALKNPKESQAQLQAVQRTLSLLQKIKDQLRGEGIPVDAISEDRYREVKGSLSDAYMDVVTAYGERTKEGVSAAKAIAWRCIETQVLAERLIGPLAECMRRQAERAKQRSLEASESDDGDTKDDLDNVIFGEKTGPAEGDTGDAAAATGDEGDFNAADPDDPIGDIEKWLEERE